MSAYPCVVTQRVTRTPIEAIFLGPVRPAAGIQTPVEALDPHAVELELGQRPKERLLQVADVLAHVLAMQFQVENRVADELARSVKGRLAAPVGLGDLHFGTVRDVQLPLELGAAPDGDDGRVLEQKYRLRNRPRETAPASDRCSSSASP